MASHFLFTGKPWLQEKTPRLHLHPTWDLKASKSLARFPYTPLESLLAPISAFHPTYLNSAAPSKAQSHPVLLAAGVGGIVVRCPQSETDISYHSNSVSLVNLPLYNCTI